MYIGIRYTFNYLIILQRSITMKIQYDIQRSLKANPPMYNINEGIEFIDRIHGNLSSIIKIDTTGNSLNPRFKDVEKYDHHGLTFHTPTGVLYDKEMMVVEQRNDGQLELISGYGRCYYFKDRNIDTYMVDVVKFKDNYWKSLWKRRFNAGNDHKAKGLPNSESSIIKGLSEAREANSFNWRLDEECMKALRFMTNGMKSNDQLEKLLKKWRQTNHADDNVRGLTTLVANNLCKKMGLPYKGYINDISLSSYDRIGFVISRDDDINIKMKSFVDLYDQWGKEIELYGFIQHVVTKNLERDRKNILSTWESSIEWMNKHFDDKYKDIVKFKGFHAQLRTRNQTDGGRPTERGIVDASGEIIIDLDPSVV